jgi:hypothetical protein
MHTRPNPSSYSRVRRRTPHRRCTDSPLLGCRWVQAQIRTVSSPGTLRTFLPRVAASQQRGGPFAHRPDIPPMPLEWRCTRSEPAVAGGATLLWFEQLDDPPEPCVAPNPVPRATKVSLNPRPHLPAAVYPNANCCERMSTDVLPFRVSVVPVFSFPDGRKGSFRGQKVGCLNSLALQHARLHQAPPLHQ